MSADRLVRSAFLRWTMRADAAAAALQDSAALAGPRST
jgi:hypothetical protein